MATGTVKAPFRSRGAKGLRPADERGHVRGLGGEMPRSHALAGRLKATSRRRRRHGQSVEPLLSMVTSPK